MNVNNVSGTTEVVRAYLNAGKTEEALYIISCLERQAENLADYLRLERAELLSYTNADETARMERWLALGEDGRMPLYRQAREELTADGIFRPESK